MLTLEQGKKLIGLARHAIETVFSKQTLYLEPYKEFSGSDQFVLVIHKDSEQRVVESLNTATLYKDIVRAARKAAFEDRKYFPIKEDELGKIRFEIALIDNPQILRARNFEEYFEMIRIGRDGIMIKGGPYQALVLPNFPLENRWDVERTLRYVCQKAGISMDAWQNIMHYQVYTFEAQVFEEISKGKIIEK